jgi:hypothetical protein
MSGLEAVAHAWFGEDVTGAGGFRFQLAAELGDVDAQVIRFRAVGWAPDILEQLLLGDQAAAIADEDL